MLTPPQRRTFVENDDCSLMRSELAGLRIYICNMLIGVHFYPMKSLHMKLRDDFLNTNNFIGGKYHVERYDWYTSRQHGEVYPVNFGNP